MPKMKTNRSIAKRFKITATGKIKLKKANLRHNLSKKNTDNKRKMRKVSYVHPSDKILVMRGLPYGN